VGGDLERRLARLRQGDHICLISESPEEPSAALVPFFKTGLAAGERCFYIGGGAAARRLETVLAQQKVPLGNELDRGALVLLTQRERWLPGGRLEPGALMDLLRQTEQQALDDGFRGLRITWDMAWLLDGGTGAERLTELEAQLNRFLAGSRTSALCRYDRLGSAAPQIESALHTHPLAVLGEQICPNCFYEPPEMVLGVPSTEDRIDWMIARLRRTRVNEEKLEELTLRLAQKSAALERADRAKEDLLTMLAHELRNPLGTISNALQVLRLKSEGDETRRRAIEAAERQVLHQALLVDDLLETSRVTRGQIELHCEELDIVDLVRETVDGYREVLETAGLELDLDLPNEPILVNGDRIRLAQALSNLLHNATKFSTAGGRIAVRILKAQSRRVEVTVSDSGLGISAEMLPHVFEVFTQADHSLDRARGGLGIGLAVVKGLMELHGGEVRARSEGAGRGAEITLLLPLAENAPGDRAQTAVDSAREMREDAAGSRRILVVEDNPDAAATLRDFLELSGHEVELACSGTDGVSAARRFHPEVVLCDLGLPGMTGFEVAAQLRRDPETASAQLIAVTGYGRDEDRRRSREAGFDLHLTKPVDPAQLRQALKTPVHHAPSQGSRA
jgi:signal transduction histidine kinase/ActR/RegA family two-component response regulator